VVSDEHHLNRTRPDELGVRFRAADGPSSSRPSPGTAARSAVRSPSDCRRGDGDRRVQGEESRSCAACLRQGRFDSAYGHIGEDY